MHAPPILLIVAGILGIVVPLAVAEFLRSADNAAAVLAVRTLSLAVVPVIIARIAYRHGFDRGSTARPSEIA